MTDTLADMDACPTGRTPFSPIELDHNTTYGGNNNPWEAVAARKATPKRLFGGNDANVPEDDHADARSRMQLFGDNVGELTIANVRPSFTAVEVSAYTPTSMDDDSGWGSTDYESSEVASFSTSRGTSWDALPVDESSMGSFAAAASASIAAAPMPDVDDMDHLTIIGADSDWFSSSDEEDFGGDLSSLIKTVDAPVEAPEGVSANYAQCILAGRRPPMRRTQSMSGEALSLHLDDGEAPLTPAEEAAENAAAAAESAARFVPTEPFEAISCEPGEALPLVDGHPDCKTIAPETLFHLLIGLYAKSFDRVIVVDCRFPYEYQGGHIQTALNLHTQAMIETHFMVDLDPEAQGTRTCVVFHCEFSSSRGPNMYRYLRSIDRTMNMENYPNLFYPETYVLLGGYKAFYQQYLSHCFPPNYVKMVVNTHKDQRQDHMLNLRRSFKRARSWSDIGGLLRSRSDGCYSPGGVNAMAMDAADTAGGSGGSSGGGGGLFDDDNDENAAPSPGGARRNSMTRFRSATTDDSHNAYFR